MTIVLFDIDGTLIRSGGAGSRAMSRAFEDIFGIAGAFDGIPMAGRTDKRILQDAVVRAGIDPTDPSLQQFREHYFRRLREMLSGSAYREPLPGVRPLLDALSARSDVFLTLLTGNCEEGARAKLEHFDLWKFFSCGAYGDDADDRNDLFAVAMANARACGVPSLPADRAIVVGDTELDVKCAIAAGARSVAVATGTSSADALRQAGADTVFPDLSDTGAFLRLLDV